MGKTAILAIRIIGDATDAVTALDKVDGSAKSMQGTMDKASAGAGLALAGLGAAALAAGDAASELEQATGAVDSVFGTYASRIHEYAATAAQDVGLAKSEYENMAAVLGAQLKNMGLSLDESAGQTKDLISLGADLAATFGGTTSDAVSALSSLMRGERDPIERYGVSIKQADIDAQKAAMGLGELTGAADAQANTQATLALLTQQTADVQGQFGREAGTVAGQQQRANAMWEDAAAKLGEQLLPLMAEGARIASELAQWMTENSETVTILAVAIGALSGGILVINGAMKAYAAIQAVQTAAQWASNAAWLASPVTWIILGVLAAIALVIAIVVLLITHWEDVQRVAGEVWANVIAWFQEVGAWFDRIIAEIAGWWEGLVSDWERGIDGFVGWIREALDWLGRLVNSAVPGWVKDMLGMNGASFSMTTTSDPAPATFTRMATFAAPVALAAPSPVVPATAASSPAVATSHTQNTYYVTNEFNGLVTDKEGTAREIRDTLRESDRNNGRVLPGNPGGNR